MGAPMGNRNAAGRHKHSFGLGKVAREARRQRSLIPSTHNQIKNFSSTTRQSERKAFMSGGASKKAKKIAINVWNNKKMR